MALIHIAFAVALVSYVLAGGLYLQKFFQQTKSTAKVAQICLMLALIAHLGILIISTQGQSSKQLSLAFVATLLAWLVSLTMLIAHKFIKNLLFLPVVCFVAAFVLIIDMFSPTTTGITVNMSVGMISHILISLLAFGLLSISLLYACQFAYINYQLKQKSRLVMSGHLPPLMSVERILYKLMIMGCILLTVALISGFVFVPNMFADGYAHKTLLSSFALITYLACILLHHFMGLRARVTVIFNFVGLFLLTLAYFGSRVVKELILN